MTAFSRSTITIATDPPTEVQAMVRGGLAVHGSAGLYTVTHVASGRAVCHSDQQRTAKGVVVELLEFYSGWVDAGIPEATKVYAKKFIEGLTIVKPQKVAQIPIVNSPLELCAIYPAYFTPSEELVALDQTIAGGDFGRIADASAVEWRETIMVRMGTGKQAKLLDKDIPEKSPPVFPLPPGILPGYAGVKQLTQQMWRLGKEIDRVAGEMIAFFNLNRDPADVNFWDFPIEEWLVYDDGFSEMVKRGWCDWAVCVNLFTQLSKEEQQKITDVLGFVGSEEQGYHAYGAKTFMRSKRLPELIRCRRAVREALND